MPRLLAAVLATAALAVGCGGSDDEPAPIGPPQTDLGFAEPERIRDCLSDAGFRVVGGQRSDSDRDAPDVELSLSTAGAPVFIAFYADSARAREHAADLEREARRLDGTYELRGGVGLLIGGSQPAAHRAPIEACAFG